MKLQHKTIDDGSYERISINGEAAEELREVEKKSIEMAVAFIGGSLLKTMSSSKVWFFLSSCVAVLTLFVQCFSVFFLRQRLCIFFFIFVF